jgi:hypothetical protein
MVQDLEHGFIVNSTGETRLWPAPPEPEPAEEEVIVAEPSQPTVASEESEEEGDNEDGEEEDAEVEEAESATQPASSNGTCDILQHFSTLYLVCIWQPSLVIYMDTQEVGRSCVQIQRIP